MSSLFTASIDSFRYQSAAASLFRDIHLSLQAGDLLLVSGPSGSGKSSFCYCLANVIPGFYTQGELRGSVTLDGTRISGMPLAQSARYVGLLLQSPERHLCHLSVAEDIAFGPENLGQSPAIIARTLGDLARHLDLNPLLARSPHTLSAGEAQRAALAATLALDPPVLVFDQPTAHLDARARQAFYQLAARLCGEEGKILVVAETDLRKSDFASLATQRLDLAGADQFPFLGAGESARAATASRGEGEAPLLAVDDLCFSYPGERTLFEIDNFVLNRGECALLLGENGTGKTSLLRTLAGLCTPQRGQIRLLGREMTRLPTARRAEWIAYLPRNPDVLLTHNSVVEEVAAAVGRQPDRAGCVRRWLEQAGLSGQAAAHPLTLAHGERYRLALSLLLARGPALLLLDEPTSMLDRGETARVCRTIAAFCAGGQSALIVTHDPEHLEAYGIVRRVFCLAGRRLSEAALGANALFSQRRPYEYSLLGYGGKL